MVYFFYVTVTNDVRHLLNALHKDQMETSGAKQFAMVVSTTSQPVSLTCSFNAASHISMRASTSEHDDTTFDVMDSPGESLTPACVLALVSTQDFDPSSSTATPFFL